MSKKYSDLTAAQKGGWIVHHGQKTANTVNASAEFSAIDVASKAASLLSQLASTDELTINRNRVEALARAAGLNPKLELPTLLDMLERKRVIDKATNGDVAVLGLTSSVTVQHAGDIFEEQDPSPEEKAAVALAEITSDAPMSQKVTSEYIGDEFKLSSVRTMELLQRSGVIGFVDAEGRDQDKIYFNGNLFRRDHLVKVQRVLNSLSTAETTKVTELDNLLDANGCVSVGEAERMLGPVIFEKLKAAGIYDLNYVTNPSGEYGFVTKPSAFHKFNDPMVDDAFDLAKALVAALSYGMTQSHHARGKIGSIRRLLESLISGRAIGPATAIGEDYKVLELKGVIRVTPSKPYGFLMKLLKRDIGEMALGVLTTGDTSAQNVLERPLGGSMTGYSGPERSRSAIRRKQSPESKRMTQDVLNALRTGGSF